MRVISGAHPPIGGGVKTVESLTAFSRRCMRGALGAGERIG
jgi:hypothetical protein